MALPNWWQVTTPHKDIKEGKLSEAIFAADLGDVLQGKAPLEYKDVSIFFQKTYLTQGIKNLLENVLTRLSKGKGDPVIQLQTPFGGGKTHSLLALYHAIKNREKVKHFEIISKLPNPKNVKVVVFVGTQADPIKGKTLWGEIAHQLGVYDKVKEHDVKRRSPGKEILNKILGDEPVLILIDELVEYIVKAKDFADQISAFSQELTEAVKLKDNCCLICTLPSSAPYGETGERALNELQRIFGRIEAVYTPVEGVEIYEIIRKRLFDDIGDEKTRQQVAQSYFNLYQKLGTDVPSEVKEVEYRERIEHAYPFHPELIDVLYERWGSFSTFQRTRGVLRLLANVVAELYDRKVSSPLIQSSLINLGNQVVKREFIKHIGNEYDSVVAADIAGKNARAPRIDKEIGSEYSTYNIASGIATSVFLYSFSGAEKKETTLPKIRVSLLREGIPHTIVGDAINKLEEQLWYFHSEKNQYAFRNQPNLNRVIVDKEETISDSKIRNTLEEYIQKIAGRSFEIYLWPGTSSDIPDNKNFKLAILSPDHPSNTDKGKNFASELFEKSGSGFRVYKNTLFILAMDENQYLALFKSFKRFLALLEIHNDKNLIESLTKDSQAEIKTKLKENEKDIPFKILTAYRRLALLEQTGFIWKDLGIPTIGASITISERVKQYLKDQEKVLTRLTPKYIIDKTFVKEENEKGLREIYELFLKTPGMALLEDERVLLDAIKEGVKSGTIGVKENLAVYYKQETSPTLDSIILRGEVAQNLKESELKKETVTENGGSPSLTPPIQKDIEPKPTKAINNVKKLIIRAKVPWDKVSSVISGVIKPIKDKGSVPEITMEIKSVSSEGFDRNTLDSKIKETLHQINATIEEWNEE